MIFTSENHHSHYIVPERQYKIMQTGELGRGKDGTQIRILRMLRGLVKTDAFLLTVALIALTVVLVTFA